MTGPVGWGFSRRGRRRLAAAWPALAVLLALLAGTFGQSEHSLAQVANATPTATLVAGASTATPQPSPTATTGPTSTPTPTLMASQSSEAVAYQGNPAHSGNVQMASFAAPLARSWSVNLGGAISYPVIAQGLVFVTVASSSGYGTNLYALNEQTGQVAWGPVALGGTYWWSAAAYDAGRLFVVNYNGLLRAFDAPSGTQLWSLQLPGQSSFTSPPTALQGTVFVGGAGTGGTLYAVGETAGTVLWSKPVVNGSDSSPALSDTGVYVSYGCPQVFGFDRVTGALLWADGSNTCSSGSGRTPVYYNQALYVRDPGSSPDGYVLDSTSGAQLGRFAAGPAPALSGTTQYSLSAGLLTATSLSSGATLWTFGGDGTLSSAPIVVNQQVFVASTSGNLYALDGASGSVVWSAAVGAGVPAPDEQNVSQPLTGLNAGDGLLVVPAGSLLVAYWAPAPPTSTPTDTLPPSPTSTSTATAIPTSTPAATATATATQTPTPTATTKKGNGHH